MMKIAHLIIRCTTRCNLSCVYCFEAQLGFDSRPVKDIPIDRVDLIMRKLKRFLPRLQTRRVNILWTGGESLLLGYNFFAKVFDIQKRLGIFDNINNAIQTNGVLLTNRFIDLLKQNNVHLSISCDVFGGMRRNKMGKTDDIVLKKLNELIKINFPFGIMTVVSRGNVRKLKRIYEMFRRSDIPFHLSILNKADTTNDSNVQPPFDELIYFTKEVLREIFRDYDGGYVPSLCIDYLGDIVAVESGNVRNGVLCNYRTDCFKNFLTLEPDGSAYPCPTFKSDFSYLGNIDRKSFQSLFDHPFKSILKRRRRRLLSKDCRECEWKLACNGGCIAEAYFSDNAMATAPLTCAYRKEIFPFISKLLHDRRMRTIKRKKHV